MILRQRGDLDLVMAQLGTLFATEGEVDKCFEYARSTMHELQCEFCGKTFGVAGNCSGTPGGYDEFACLDCWANYLRTDRVTRSVEDHIRSAPEREAAALREWARSTNWRWRDGE